MPKALKVHPGERVDLVDYVQGANVYTQESQKFLVERELIDRRARIFDGFKIRVEDQTLNPGLITIFNGNAVDRDGQIVNNEDSANDSRSVTLLGINTNFYLEIEYTDAPSDTDARYFWDPTTPNTPPIPDGSEFVLNVATRISPDWRIVTPVSTTGFSQTTNPDSLRIPLCVLRTNALNQVTAGVDNPGLVLVTPSTVLESDLPTIGIVNIRVVDARTMPVPPFNIIIDDGGASPEARTVSAIDRDNGILTISVATAAIHSAGAIVRVSGTPLFVKDKTDPNFPITDLAIPGHPDLAQRMWQADEIRGSGLLQSKETFGARDDLNLRCLKDEIDFLSAQIREMKFGHPRTDTTSAAPPFSFSTRPRYFDPAGSIQGARSSTVSIGNGTTTFGDFNGTSEAAFIAAVNALPAAGGTVFVKSGTYQFANTVTVGKSVTIVGENFNSTVIQNQTPAGPALSFTTDASIENITISQGTGGAYLAVDIAGSVTVTFNYSAILAAVRLNGAVNAAVHARRTLFSNTDPGIGVIIATGGGTLTLSHFDACSFTNLSGPVFSSAINSLTVTNSFVFAVSMITTALGTSVVNNVVIQNCDITVTASVLFSYGTQTFNGIRVLNNQIVSLTLPAGFAVCWFTSTTALSSFTFENNSVSVTAISGTYLSPSAIVSTTANTSVADVALKGNTVSFPINSIAWAVFYVTDAVTTSSKNVYVLGNSVTRGNGLVRIGASTAQMLSGLYVISENCHNNSSSTEGAIGVEFYNTATPPRPTSVNVVNNLFLNYTHNSGGGGNRIGVECTFDSNDNAQINIEGNLMYSFGSSAVSTYTAGVNFSPIFTAASGTVKIRGNKILYLGAVGNDCAGISVRPSIASARIDVDVSNNSLVQVGKYASATPVNSYGIQLDTIRSGTVANNYVYDVGTDSNDGVCLLLNSCGDSSTDAAGVTVVGNRLFYGSTSTLSANNGYNLLVTGSSAHLVIGNNVCSQFNSVNKANYGIYVDNSTADVVIDSNIVVTNTTGALTSGIFVLGTTQDFTVSNNIIDLHSSGLISSGIYISVDGNSSGIRVNNNTVRERVLIGGGTHVGIDVYGALTGLNRTRGVYICGNTLSGLRTGVLVTGRIGLRMTDCEYSMVSHNLVDWLWPTVAEGTGITITATSPGWYQFSCVGNSVTSDNNNATSEIFLGTANVQSGILDSNIVGNLLILGVITPAAPAGGWTYGTNMLS